ncbi:MAG: hypothetical protein B6D55_05130 [Candidatus Omnitrophica bacterium 4484_70.2]|nr:MAG: hypothetical protein B6D55_05130 [Candidatus Omnitrophica bacterium 4484_70.2]
MINLLKNEIKQKAFRKRREIIFTRVLFFLTICIGIVALVSYFLLNVWENKDRRILTKIVGDREEARRASKKIDDLKSLLSYLEEEWKIYKNFSSRKLIWHEKLSQLQEIIPEEMWIKEFSFDILQRKLSLKGALINLTDKNLTYFLGKFVNSIKTTAFFEGFKKVILSKVRRRQKKNFEIMDFDLDFILTD